MRPVAVVWVGRACWLVVGTTSMLLGGLVHPAFFLVTVATQIAILAWEFRQRCPECGARLVRGVFPVTSPLETKQCRNCQAKL